MKYATHVSVRKTPQTEEQFGKDQIRNSAGGFSFKVDDWTRLDRFLILGNEGGSYYASERKLTRENAKNILNLISKSGIKVVDRVVEISEAGRAPKNDPAIFVLALAAKLGDDATRKAAYDAVNRVCRIGTHVFAFADAIEAFGGWSRGTRRAISNWYTEKTPEALAYQYVKYQQRNGRSHRDLLRLAHLYAPEAGDKSGLVEYIRTGNTEQDLPRIMNGFALAQVTTESKDIARLISEYKLPREAVPTQFLTDANVWEALLQDMPMTAMIRNLATMTRIGVVADFSEGTKKVLSELSNTERLHKSRVHPIQILSALLTYSQGHGVRGQNTWTPVQKIVDSLNDAFYASFKNVEPAGKNFLLGQDVSGSMGGGVVAGIPGLTPAKAAAAMVLVTMNTEPMAVHRAFDTGMKDIGISPKMRLDDVVSKTCYNGGGTDCALPMLYATKHNLPIDTFVVYTDNETWVGRSHPDQALREYRQKSGRPAKLVVVGMVANDFTIADPDDAGMLDVVGFDTNVPAVITDFAKG